MEQREVVAEGKELLTCPDCGEEVEIEDKIESQGEGIAFGYISCSDNCGFEAREEWVIDKTLRA